ncbi:HNH endonuclease [Haloarcula sp. Atlit-47R]|nr:HNH endonuclease [Haloarcula sp. Atlit-47R]
MEEIGERLGCSARTVCRWLKKHGIESRDQHQAHSIRHDAVPFRTHTTSYERWLHRYRGERESVRVHRLVAVAEYGFDQVVGKDVHHKNSIPWDNRPENLEPVSHAEHSQIHGLERAENEKRNRGESA